MSRTVSDGRSRAEQVDVAVQVAAGDPCAEQRLVECAHRKDRSGQACQEGVEHGRRQQGSAALLLQVLAQFGGQLLTVPLTRTPTGVGTTGVAAEIAESGRTVLVVDLDSQRNATEWLGAVSGEYDVLSVLMREAGVDEAAVPAAVPGVEVVPATAELTGVERGLPVQ